MGSGWLIRLITLEIGSPHSKKRKEWMRESSSVRRSVRVMPYGPELRDVYYLVPSNVIS